ncbi:histidine--tRNA ligase [Priestia taiwanensis]|uniref:Histidine--tRNA ligase n=1 Tax=Priestia taiwanensis TaxID=1347902 RepID=A0A917AIL0_9BACI|nr:histidine--tRNA ligase [Priestia taiwanensis]MBM7361666.1 histidyl-tRNA synthetase [Priestia taiwanensis]GGE56009.1 histidine--tRNA ligase 1 [Priestia taiwanensis]
MLQLKNVRGTKDFNPGEQRLRNTIKETCEKAFRLYGFKPLETPIFNEFDLMAYKYGGGAEILKEVYQLTDQGGRQLALRYDLTIPFTKYIGMNKDTIRFPFKRYEIGKVFRDGPVKVGRHREFTQCDVDVVGVKAMSAEAELMAMASEILQSLGIDVVIEYNNRKLLEGILLAYNIREELIGDVILTVDKFNKIGITGVQDELREKQVEEDMISQISELLAKETFTFDYFKQTFSNELVQEGIRELEELNVFLDCLCIRECCMFNPFLARGLNMYTGTIYEIFVRDGSFSSSIGSGGRYDRIIGQYVGDGEEYPTVGMSLGLESIFTVLENRLQREEVFVDVYIIPLDTWKESLQVAMTLRKQGIRVEVEQMNRRLKNALNYANKENIRYVFIIGENELEKKEIVCKDMFNKTERKIPLEEIEKGFFKI